MSVFFVCPEHGSVFIHRGAGPSTPILGGGSWDQVPLEPLIEGVHKPRWYDRCACPLCGADWTLRNGKGIRRTLPDFSGWIQEQLFA